MDIVKEKLGLELDYEKVSQLLCKKYKLGDYLNYSIINTGIEDINYCLTTTTKKYLIKIFNSNRNKENLIDYVKKYNLLENYNVMCPKMIKDITILVIDNIEISLIIMEYIEGEDLYTSKETISIHQLSSLINMINTVHNVPSHIPCIYDEYHIHNFNKTYNKCISFLDAEWQKVGENLKENYDKIDFTKMPKTFIHGDLHKGNIMKSSNNNLYLIDFASCGYSYHILDVIEFINNTLFDYREFDISIKRIKYFLKNYKLSQYEKENLGLLINCYAFISIALKKYDIFHSQNQREETTYWMENNINIIKNNIIKFC